MRKQYSQHTSGGSSQEGSGSSRSRPLIAFIVLPMLVALAVYSVASDRSDTDRPEAKTTKRPAVSQRTAADQPGPHQSSAADASYEINWQTVSSGSSPATASYGGEYRLEGTLGQIAIGGGSNGADSINSGFWAPCCIEPMRGNVDYDPGDAVDISDLVYLVDYMFNDGPPPPCRDEADINGDCVIDISDLVWLVDYMFTGGPPPVPCP